MLGLTVNNPFFYTAQTDWRDTQIPRNLVLGHAVKQRRRGVKQPQVSLFYGKAQQFILAHFLLHAKTDQKFHSRCRQFCI